ncbi:MAG: hypothetical protein CL613_01085 [Aquimarina sp.]|nr:hypothetical protein [Aquimarina sp.]
MIKDVYFSYLNPESLINLSTQSITVISTNHPDQPLLSTSISKLDAAIKEAEKAVGKTAKEALTGQVFQADSNRDSTFIALRTHIEAGLRRHRNTEYKTACERLYAIIEKHGKDVYKLPYAEQSTVFTALLQELKSGIVHQDVSTINAGGFVDDLDQDQQEFDTVYTKRNEEKAANTSITDRQAIKLLKPELNKFYTLINALYISEQVPDIDKSINEINSIIDRIMASAKRS